MSGICTEAADVDDDLAQCEGCGKRHPWDQTRFTDDGCNECPDCQAMADQAFAECRHDWTPSHNSHGEPGQYCGRCCHIVNDEDFPRLFPGVALPARREP